MLNRQTCNPCFCNVTALSFTHVNFLQTIHFLAGRWSTSGPKWVTHISCHHKNTIGETGENKTDEQTRTMLMVNSEQKESMQHYISHSIYGLTLAWITSENSTKQLECRRLLTRSSYTGPYLLCYYLTTPVSGVNCPCPWFHANSFCCPVANCLSAPLSNQLSFASLTTSGYGEISGQKILCRFWHETRQRSRLLGGPPI